MIEVERLSKRYGDTFAIKDVGFTVERGQVVGFLGPNGAGKSTTMRIISGSLGASAGKVMVGGTDVAESPRKVQAMLGYAPETPPLYGNMLVRDYVAFAATLRGVADVKAATEKALAAVGLVDVAGRIIDNLSKGYRQRVGLAQALVHEPHVLVLDEPTSGLDPAQRVEIRHLLQELAAGDRTVILSTHVLSEIEAICDRVIIINRGRIVTTDALAAGVQDGRLVRVLTARPGVEAVLRAIPGVSSVDPAEDLWVVRADRDVREEIAKAAVPFGLLELSGRQRLEDVYLAAIKEAA